MSVFSAIFLPGLFLIASGASLLSGNPLVQTTLKAMPRSPVAAALFWGAGALWFLCVVGGLSQADLLVFETPAPWFAIYAAIAAAAFYFLPDFLAIRGLCVLTLLVAWQILMGLFGEFGGTLAVKALVYVAIGLAIYLGCAPYRARDFIQWLFTRAQRARTLGALLLACGLLFVGIAFWH